jgi:hypothetical protein
VAANTFGSLQAPRIGFETPTETAGFVDGMVFMIDDSIRKWTVREKNAISTLFLLTPDS